MASTDLVRVCGRLLDPYGWFILPHRFEAIVSVLENHLKTGGPGFSEDPEFREATETMGEGLALRSKQGGGRQGERPEDRFYSVEDGVAVIPIVGIIGKRLSMMEQICGGADLNGLNRAAELALADDRVDGVLLDVSSPGGMGTGLPETTERLGVLAAAKPLVAFSDTDMCSAAYWLATAANAGIWAAGSARVGSVGVYVALTDVSASYEKLGFRHVMIRSGDLKGIGTPGKEVTEQELEFVTSYVDRHAQVFETTVREARSDVSDDVFRGQFFDGNEALEKGLVDAVVPTLEDALEVFRMAKV